MGDTTKVDEYYERAAQRIFDFYGGELKRWKWNEKEKGEIEEIIKNFQGNYSPENLKSKELDKIWFQVGNKDENKPLLNKLIIKKDPLNYYFGGLGSPFITTYDLHKDKDNEWYTMKISLNEKEAKSLSDSIVSELSDVYDTINQKKDTLNSIQEYEKLQKEITEKFNSLDKKDIIKKGVNLNMIGHSWWHKYFCILFPNKFVPIHNKQIDILKCCGIEPNESGYFARDGQFVKLINKLNEKLEKKNGEGVKLTLQEGHKLIYDYWEKNDKMQRVIKLLKANKQVIMNGAPGTGKTFSAKGDIADALLGIIDESGENYASNKYKNIRLKMVQFHPSYDYTDFIEGIRPNLSGEGISYTLKNGVFKSFCRDAGVPERIIAAGDVRGISAKTIEEFADGEKGIVAEFWKSFFEEDLKKGTINKEKFEEIKSNLPAFVFIIDEINRAEISKVFGETMFCLDADYRGENGRIATQYSTSATKETFFVNKTNDEFFIPSNVYIIGTMNDIDRSVEVFDFAMRRRFGWQEIKAQDVMDKILVAMGVKNAMQKSIKLNNKEEKTIYEHYMDKIKAINDGMGKLHLNEHYHLGPSYFAKILNFAKVETDKNGESKPIINTPEDFKKALTGVWDNHLSQILYEYVKGRPSLENEVKKIGDEFLGNNQGKGTNKNKTDEKVQEENAQ